MFLIVSVVQLNVFYVLRMYQVGTSKLRDSVRMAVPIRFDSKVMGNRQQPTQNQCKRSHNPPARLYNRLVPVAKCERSLTLYRTVMPIGTQFLKEKINN